MHFGFSGVLSAKIFFVKWRFEDASWIPYDPKWFNSILIRGYHFLSGQDGSRERGSKGRKKSWKKRAEEADERSLHVLFGVCFPVAISLFSLSLSLSLTASSSFLISSSVFFVSGFSLYCWTRFFLLPDSLVRMTLFFLSHYERSRYL